MAQIWATLVLAQIFHGLQVQIAAEARVEVFDVSIDLLVRLVPRWLQQGISPVEQAVNFGRDMRLIRPSTRHQVEVPWIDPSWVQSPPLESLLPREKAHYRSQAKPAASVASAKLQNVSGA